MSCQQKEEILRGDRIANKTKKKKEKKKKKRRGWGGKDIRPEATKKRCVVQTTRGDGNRGSYSSIMLRKKNGSAHLRVPLQRGVKKSDSHSRVKGKKTTQNREEVEFRRHVEDPQSVQKHATGTDN